MNKTLSHVQEKGYPFEMSYLNKQGVSLFQTTNSKEYGDDLGNE